MPGDLNHSHSAREQTDASLRLEREKADRELAEIEDTADAVILRARARADRVLASARRQADGALSVRPDAVQSDALAGERGKEDDAVQEERETADRALHVERTEHVAVLSDERLATDKDLTAERARADTLLATRDEFLGVVSHDLRNMLAIIGGYAALIAKEASAESRPEQVLEHAQRIQRSGTRMNRLIGDLVDLASMEAGKFALARQVGDPAHVIEESVAAFQVPARAKGIALAADVAGPAWLAAFDPARLSQVLTNLLSNALKFVPADGEIVVRVERLHDELRISVRDTGIGIPSEMLVEIFDRFRQVKSGDGRGAGLGLYISKRIVQAHGGRIWAESRIGEGSTFFFTLPIHQPSAGSDPASSAFRERRRDPRP
jgi:signal transduction histidine kinase